jgi:hypothetical protein
LIISIVSGRTKESALRLIVSSNSLNEFAALGRVLTEAKIEPVFVLSREGIRRPAREYSVSEIGKISLQKVLGGQFLEHEGGISFRTTDGGDFSYACKEISVSGFGSACRDLTAPSDDVALVKCAIVAGELHWFGGVAEKGACRNVRD